MILTVDLGNSTLSWILHDGNDRVAAGTVELNGSLPRDLFREIAEGGFTDRLTDVAAASVVPSLDDSLRELCRERFNLSPRFIDYRSAGELVLAVDNPKELGADRIAACLGALRLCAPPLLVIDSGTATTFDLVDEMNVYIGGAIAPGLSLMIRSLAQNTAKLKEIPFREPAEAAARNTADHIRVGVYHHFVGGIERLIREYRKLMGRNVTVVASGGGFRLLGALPQGIDRYEPDLVHLGLKGFRGKSA